MNYKELDKNYSAMVNQVAAPQQNKDMLVDIVRYLKSQHKATDERTKEYKKSVQDTIDNQKKALEEAYAEIDMLKQSNEKYEEKNTNQIKIIQDAHEANKRLVEENKFMSEMYELSYNSLSKEYEVLKRANEELVKDIKVLEDRNKTFDELNAIVKKHKGLIALVDNFSYSE